MKPVVSVRGLSRSFDGVKAVSDLTFDIEPGTVFGLIGPNGAGKTTALQMLLGLARPDAGHAFVFGEPALRLSSAARQRIGYMTEDALPFSHLAVGDVLRYVSSFYEEWDWAFAQSLLDRLRVPTKTALDDLSLGERRRAELAVALAPKPDLLVLDDPTLGLDAAIRREFLWSALELAGEEGKTVLFTSHVLHDVERIVDRVGIMLGGRLQECADLDALKARTKRLVFKKGEAPAAVHGEIARRRDGSAVVVTTSAFGSTELAGCPPHEVEDLNLEEIFCDYAEGSL